MLFLPNNFMFVNFLANLKPFKQLLWFVITFFLIMGCTLLSSLVFSYSTLYTTDNNLPSILKGFIAPGFSDLEVLTNSPFGGTGLENTVVTAYYKDVNYYKQFGRWHLGADLIPNGKYYITDAGYKLYKEALIYATCSGMASSLRDSAGANYIYLVCDNKQYALLFVHNKINFIPIGKKGRVKVGQPIAVLGTTGNSTGLHVHYAVKDLKTNQYVNPLDFILK